VEVFINPLEQTGSSNMKATTVGIDLAKTVFQLPVANVGFGVLESA
jgi:hypothetical protein